MSIHQSIDSLLHSAQLAINNATTHPEVQAALALYGYTPERLQEGNTLYATALAAHHQRQREYGEQIGATARLNQAWDTARATYMQFVKIARVALKGNPGLMIQLGLNGCRKRTLSGWLLQARQFYGNLLADPAALEAMAHFGITQTKLEAGLAAVQVVETAHLIQGKQKGEAQDATQAQNAAIDRLEVWLSDFVAIARVALSDRPQLLEILGIVVKS